MAEPQPSKAQIGRFLKFVEVLANFEAQQQAVRGYGAFDPKDWPDKPDDAVLTVRRWLTGLSD